MERLVRGLPPRSPPSRSGRTPRQYLRAGNIVIGHANFPAVTAVYDDIIGLIQERSLPTVTLADVYRPAPS